MLALTVAACDVENDHEKINGSVDVAAGQPLKDATTVNGAIRVAEGRGAKKPRR